LTYVRKQIPKQNSPRSEEISFTLRHWPSKTSKWTNPRGKDENHGPRTQKRVIKKDTKQRCVGTLKKGSKNQRGGEYCGVRRSKTDENTAPNEKRRL